MKPWLRLGLLFPHLLAAAAAAAAAPALRGASELAHLFDYDSRQPLEIHDKTLKEFDCGAIHDITYVSPSGGLVSAYQIVPKGKGPFAAILFGHWGNGTRAEFIPDAEAYACAGAISLLPDYRWERPRPAYSEVDDLAHPDLDLRVRINTVIEMRRAIDLLLSRTDVDPNRVAYVGHSFGAQWGAILSSVDSRVKCAVLMAGAAEEGDLWLRSDNPRIADLRATLPGGQLEAYVKAVQELNAINYISHSRIPLLLQFGNFEQYFDRSSMERYAAAAAQPKRVLFYDSAHDLNDPKAFKDRSAWLSGRLPLRAASSR